MVALFDLDGVIIDTEPTYSKFWGEMGRKYSVGVDNFSDVIKGTTLTQILERYFPADVRSEVVGQLVEFEKVMAYDLFPGAVDFLQRLRQASVACAIVTSSNLEKMDNLWKQHPDLRQYFDVVITDEDVTRSKPDPEPYLLAAARLGCKPEEAYVFEDSFNGILSGNRAGAKVIALDTTNPRSELIDKVDLVVSSLSDLQVDASGHIIPKS